MYCTPNKLDEEKKKNFDYSLNVCFYLVKEKIDKKNI